jgi:hypothetical protein
MKRNGPSPWKCFVLFMAFTLGSASANAQSESLDGIPATESLSKKVTELFSQNKISQAFDALRPYWPLAENEIEAVEEKTLKYMNVIVDRFGPSIGIVKVKTETIADIALRETYLIRYEYTAIRVKIIYYQNNDGWIVNSFKWDDTFSEEF